MKKILSLDFDDCIINWNFASNEEKMKEEIIKNFKIIKQFVKKYDYKIAIHSSWGQVWDIKKFGDAYDDFQIWFRNKFIEYFGEPLYVDYKGGRKKFLIELSKKYKIIALDDFDLSNIENENLIFVKTIYNVNIKLLEKVNKRLF